jgi:curved DNA-binding protein
VSLWPVVLLLLLSLQSCFQHCSGVVAARTTSGTKAAFIVPRGGARSPTKEHDEHSHHRSKPSSASSKKKRKSSDKNAKDASSTKHHKSSASSSPVVEEILKEDDYYKILGLSKDAIASSKHVDRDIKKAYRKRAVFTHPDKTGGDRRAFDKVAEAYEVLADNDKRSLYDRYGKDGMKQRQFGGGGGGGTAAGGMGGMSAEDLFRSFFGSAATGGGFGGSGGGFGGGGGFGRGQQRPRQQRQRQFFLDVPLEDLYTGTTKTVQLPEGETIECVIPRGLRDGTGVTVETSGGESIILIVRPQPHHLFTKLGTTADLMITVRISLTEAITGVQRRLRLLDGSYITIASAGDNDSDDDNTTIPAVIETGDVQVLKGYGMPKEEGSSSSSSSEKGNLYIQYEVSIAKNRKPRGGKAALSDDEMIQLKTLLAKLEGRLSSVDTKSNWPYNNGSNNKENPKKNNTSSSKVKRLQKASPQDIEQRQQQQTSRNPFEAGGFSFGAGFSPFGSTFFSSGGF